MTGGLGLPADASQVVDADRGLHRDVHAAAGHHDRERRAARHPARAEGQLLPAAVGDRRLCADARRAAPHGGECIFFLNLPIGVACIAVSQLRVRETRDPGASGIDWAGVLTFSAALFVLVLALIRGNAEGWGSALIVSLLVGAGVLLVVFLAIERRQEQPMLDLSLF